jgi:hypothetical protein
MTVLIYFKGMQEHEFKRKELTTQYIAGLISIW